MNLREAKFNWGEMHEGFSFFGDDQVAYNRTPLKLRPQKQDSEAARQRRLDADLAETMRLNNRFGLALLGLAVALLLLPVAIYFH